MTHVRTLPDKLLTRPISLRSRAIALGDMARGREKKRRRRIESTKRVKKSRRTEYFTLSGEL